MRSTRAVIAGIADKSKGTRLSFDSYAILIRCLLPFLIVGALVLIRGCVIVSSHPETAAGKEEVIRFAESTGSQVTGQKTKVVSWEYSDLCSIRKNLHEKAGDNTPLRYWNMVCDTENERMEIRLRRETRKVVMFSRHSLSPEGQGHGAKAEITSSREAAWLGAGYLKKLGYGGEQWRPVLARRSVIEKVVPCWELRYQQQNREHVIQTVQMFLEVHGGSLDQFLAASPDVEPERK